MILGGTRADILDILWIIVITGQSKSDRSAVFITAKICCFYNFNITHLDSEFAGTGGAVFTGCLDMQGMAILGFIVDMSMILESNHTAFRINGKGTICSFVTLFIHQGIGYLISFRICCQTGQMNLRAVSGIFSNDICTLVRIEDGTDTVIGAGNRNRGRCRIGSAMAVTDRIGKMDFFLFSLGH